MALLLECVVATGNLALVGPSSEMHCRHVAFLPVCKRKLALASLEATDDVLLSFMNGAHVLRQIRLLAKSFGTLRTLERLCFQMNGQIVLVVVGVRVKASMAAWPGAEILLPMLAPV